MRSPWRQQISMAARPLRHLQCVDLFAGAGGLFLAARNAEMEVVAAVEIDKHACATCRRNLMTNGTPKLYVADLRALDPTELKQAHFGDGNRCDLVLGGPPYQGFSVYRFKDAGVSDPRNELVFQYLRFVDVLRPKAFLMENVPGLCWPRYENLLNNFYARGRSSGYEIRAPEILDARFQTFPDDFVFKGGLMAAGAQSSNAVPVQSGERLLHTIADGLSDAIGA